MAKMSSKTRNNLPNSAFAGPDRSYPVNDRAHAANAKARASQQANKGNLSKAEKGRIDAKADRVLDKGKPKSETPAKRPSTSMGRATAASDRRMTKFFNND